jgi:Ca-activated chloride channel family protein
MKKFTLIFVCGLIGLSGVEQAKKHILKGQVTDIDGQPIKKALVLDISIADSTRTDDGGLFSLYSSVEIKSVEVSKAGCDDTRMSSNGSTFITIRMAVKQDISEPEISIIPDCVIPQLKDEKSMEMSMEIISMDATNASMTRHKAMNMGGSYMWQSPIEANTETYSEFSENDFHLVKNEPLSTFSIDVDRA